MPLIIVTGFPCSGKTFRTQQLLDEFSGRIAASLPSSERLKTVLDIPSQHSVSDARPDPPVRLRDQIYNSAAAEKNARAVEFSNIKRALSKDAIVISDSLNYIKGYRYQLWCEAKAAGTRCCVVHVAAREDECVKWNSERLTQRRDSEEGEEITPGDANGQGQGQNSKKLVGLGELIPASHTALYGDRYDFEQRSRSSSIDVELGHGAQDHSLTSLWLPDLRPEAAPSLAFASLSLQDSSRTEEHEPLPSTTHSNGFAPIDTSSPITYPQQSSHPPPPTFPPSLPYDPMTLQSLILRYEPPSPFSRWDTPLFTLPSTDPHPPYDAIWSALFPSTAPSRKVAARNGNNPNSPAPASVTATATATDAGEVRPHAATVLPPSTSAQALQLLERTTAEVVAALFTAYKEQSVGDESGDLTISLPSNTEQNGMESDTELSLSLSISIPPSTTLTQPMMQRLRRKFTQMQRGGIAHGKGHAVERGRKGVVEAFGRFLEAELES